MSPAASMSTPLDARSYTRSALKLNFTGRILAFRVFGYHDGGHHVSRPHLVLIGIASFVNDIVGAIEAFLAARRDDADLRARVEPRLVKVLHTFLIQAP